MKTKALRYYSLNTHHFDFERFLVRDKQKLTIPSKHNPSLDGLRGIAIMMVMVFHATPNLLVGGFIGVDIFFVLSGFLITNLLIREHEQHERLQLTAFYMRRILRLSPALLLMLLTYCIASFIWLADAQLDRFLTDALISLLYLTNWARAFGIHPPDFLGHTWSLAIEEQFYLLWPLFLTLMIKNFKRRELWLAATLILALLSLAWRVHLSTSGASPMRLYNGLDTRADALMIGCTLAILLSLPQIRNYLTKRTSHLIRYSAVISSMGLCLFAIFGEWNSPGMFYWGYILVAICSASVIADLTQDHPSVLNRILSTPLLVWIGTISYGLYLWHFPVYRVLLANGWSQKNVLWLGSLITLAIAACSYYLLEAYFLKLKQRHFTPKNSAGENNRESPPA